MIAIKDFKHSTLIFVHALVRLTAQTSTWTTPHMDPHNLHLDINSIWIAEPIMRN